MVNDLQLDILRDIKYKMYNLVFDQYLQFFFEQKMVVFCGILFWEILFVVGIYFVLQIKENLLVFLEYSVICMINQYQIEDVEQ